MSKNVYCSECVYYRRRNNGYSTLCTKTKIKKVYKDWQSTWEYVQFPDEPHMKNQTNLCPDFKWLWYFRLRNWIFGEPKENA